MIENYSDGFQRYIEARINSAKIEANLITRRLESELKEDQREYSLICLNRINNNLKIYKSFLEEYLDFVRVSTR